MEWKCFNNRKRYWLRSSINPHSLAARSVFFFIYLPGREWQGESGRWEGQARCSGWYRGSVRDKTTQWLNARMSDPFSEPLPPPWPLSLLPCENCLTSLKSRCQWKYCPPSGSSDQFADLCQNFYSDNKKKKKRENLFFYSFTSSPRTGSEAFRR